MAFFEVMWAVSDLEECCKMQTRWQGHRLVLFLFYYTSDLGLTACCVRLSLNAGWTMPLSLKTFCIVSFLL